MAGVEALVKEGWLHKNHAGSPFSAQHTRRWFSSSGFNVIYYANNDKKTIKRATGGVPLPRELCIVLDDRTAVWEEATQPHILAVAPFMPYATDTGPGLQGGVDPVRTPVDPWA